MDNGAESSRGGQATVPIAWHAVDRLLARQEQMPADLARLMEQAGGQLVRREITRGQCLFHAGERLRWLYQVRSGFFKTCLVNDTGREQVVDFFMRADILGADAMEYECHTSTAIALEDSEVDAIAYAPIEEISRSHLVMRRGIEQVFADALERKRRAGLLASLRPGQRLAAFLIDLSDRYACRGYSGVEFRLRMTRMEVAAHIGSKPETLDQAFARLRKDGLLETFGKRIIILDLERLVGVVQGNG